jgi:hypothetical protein
MSARSARKLATEDERWGVESGQPDESVLPRQFGTESIQSCGSLCSFEFLYQRS